MRGLFASTFDECRSPYGERGLKCHVHDRTQVWPGRSPYGERGLKYIRKGVKMDFPQSLSLRRAWIEIFVCDHVRGRRGRSPYGERGLKLLVVVVLAVLVLSLSLRRAWIEIWRPAGISRSPHVALLTESVD